MTRVQSYDEWVANFDPMPTSNKPALLDTIPNSGLMSEDMLQRTWSIIEAEGDKFLRSGYTEDALGYMFTRTPAKQPTLAVYKYN